MSRRVERIEQARQRRHTHNLLGIGAAALVVLAIVTIIVWASGNTPEAVSGLTAAELPRIAPQEAYRLMQAEEAALYDVRSAEVYRALHAEGALSLPEAEAIQRMAELPEDRTLILY